MFCSLILCVKIQFMERVILHVDQNCFFASVEMIYNPECRNVPMAVVGDKEKRHGIILAKNQLASKSGVKTAEAIWQAQQKCPNLVTLPAHYEKYQFYSEKLRALYEEYTDRVEPFGLDECWLDITDSLGGREPAEIANEIRERVKAEFNLTCSVGVSFNKIFAKLGSDYKKPDATTLITEDNYKEIVWPLPVSDLLFVGKNSTKALNQVNITTIGDLANSDKSFIERYMGKAGHQLWTYANGLDDSPVQLSDYRRQVKSVGNSTTTAKDMVNKQEVHGTIRYLSATVAKRLREHKVVGGCIQISVKDTSLAVYEHQRMLYAPTDIEGVIYKNACELFDESYDWHSPVRSVGVRCTKIEPAGGSVQLSIFNDLDQSSKDSKLANVIDSINRRHGTGAIRSATELTGNQDEV